MASRSKKKEGRIAFVDKKSGKHSGSAIKTFADSFQRHKPS